MSNLRDLFVLRPDIIFFNHGSYGACPRSVFDTYQEFQLELERQPVDFMRWRLANLLGEARQALGDFIGAAADDVVFVTNASTGINIVARSLVLEPGDEVLATDHEYGFIDKSWRFVCDKRGAHYIRQTVPLPATSAEQVVEAVWSRVTPRTRVLTFSHITSPTAMILPVEELVRRAREAGITTVIDGAHAAGQVPLDVKAMGADFYVGNCHKWMMAPKGAGFLYARREVQSLLEPLVGGRMAEGAVGSQLVGEREYYGTRDSSAALSVPSAIRFMQENNWPNVQRACHERIRQVRKAFEESTGLAPPVPDGRDWFPQMCILPLPPCDSASLTQRLRDEFMIEIPGTSWNGLQFLRLSVQAYNTQADLDALVEAVAVLLPQVVE